MRNAQIQKYKTRKTQMEGVEIHCSGGGGGSKVKSIPSCWSVCRRDVINLTKDWHCEVKIQTCTVVQYTVYIRGCVINLPTKERQCWPVTGCGLSSHKSLTLRHKQPCLQNPKILVFTLLRVSFISLQSVIQKRPTVQSGRYI